MTLIIRNKWKIWSLWPPIKCLIDQALSLWLQSMLKIAPLGSVVKTTIKITPILSPPCTHALCTEILQFLSSRSGTCFSTPWVRAQHWTCCDQENTAQVTLPLPSLGPAHICSLSWNPARAMRPVWANQMEGWTFLEQRGVILARACLDQLMASRPPDTIERPWPAKTIRVIYLTCVWPQSSPRQDQKSLPVTQRLISNNERLFLKLLWLG